VGDGDGAIGALEADIYDIVLMDVRLPGLDGPAVTAELRRREADRGRRIPVIAMTAGAMTGDAERALLAGMDDFVAKPLRPHALRQALVRWGRAASDRRSHDVSTVVPDTQRASPILDRQILAECCDGNAMLMSEVLEAFLRSTPGSLSSIAAAAARGASPDLEREAHRLQGTCQTIGATPMAADCAALLALARQGEVGSTPDMLKALRNHWESVREEARAYLEALRSQ
jgi:CheY-like chemotaxis protein/HPt (histidine-containing phosphotransfer) domain-containing protein